MIAGGRRDRLIRFERATTVTDDNGFEQPAWAELERAWANINFGRGEERRGASRENVEITATFRVLTTANVRGLTPKDRLVTEEDGRVWDITSAVPFGHAEYDVTAIWSA
jgi:SPP1 family predicted phage head-tail adaptor